MNRIYMDAKDKNVSATLIYVDEHDNFYYTETMTGDDAVEVSQDDYYELFAKGVIAVKAGVYYAPLAFDPVNKVLTFMFNMPAEETETTNTETQGQG